METNKYVQLYTTRGFIIITNKKKTFVNYHTVCTRIIICYVMTYLHKNNKKLFKIGQ